MKHADFISKLILRYPKLEDTRYQLQDIKDNLRPVSESTLDDLWQAFNSHYDGNSSPRWSSIFLAAQKADVHIETANRINFWVYECQYCGTYFGGHHGPIDGPKCTGCKTYKPAKIIILAHDQNPFNMNHDKFGDKSGNTAIIPPIEPHRLSLEWPKWVKDHTDASVLANEKLSKINDLLQSGTSGHFSDSIPF